MIPFKWPIYLFYACNSFNMAIKLSKCKHLSTPAEDIKGFICDHMDRASNLLPYQIDSYQSVADPFARQVFLQMIWKSFLHGSNQM